MIWKVQEEQEHLSHCQCSGGNCREAVGKVFRGDWEEGYEWVVGRLWRGYGEVLGEAVGDCKRSNP